jgi:hypothetical protein
MLNRIKAKASNWLAKHSLKYVRFLLRKYAVENITNIDQSYNVEIGDTIYNLSCTLLYNGIPIAEEALQREKINLGQYDVDSACLELKALAVHVMAKNIFDLTQTFDCGMYDVSEFRGRLYPQKHSESKGLIAKSKQICGRFMTCIDRINKNQMFTYEMISITDIKCVLYREEQPLFNENPVPEDIQKLRCRVFQMDGPAYLYKLSYIGDYTVEAVSEDGEFLKLGQLILD